MNPFLARLPSREKTAGRARQILAALTLPLLVLLLGGSAPAHAWGNTFTGINLERLVSSVHTQAGPFRVEPALRVGNAGYDSNLYYGSAYPPVPDYTINTGLAARVFLPLQKRVVFDFNELIQYAYYARTERQRGWNNYFQGTVHLVLRNTCFSLGIGLTNARQRLNTETDTNVRLKESQYNGAVDWQLSRRVSSSLQLSQARYNYEDQFIGISNVSRNLSRTENSARFTGFYQPFSAARLFVSGQYGDYNFRSPLNPRDSRSYEISTGVEFIGLVKLHGIIDLGYTSFTSVKNLAQGYQGLVGNTSLAYAPWKRTEFQASFQRDIVFSTYSDLAYFVQTLAGAGVSQWLTRHVALSYTLSLGRNSYPLSEEEAAGPEAKRIDNYVIHSLGLNLRLNRDLRLNLVVNLRHRDSTVAWADDQKYFLGFNLSYVL